MGKPEVQADPKSKQTRFAPLLPVGHSDRTTMIAGISSASLGRGEELGELCCAIDSHVDRTFLFEVFFPPAAQKVLRAVHHEQIPPKFSSNTRLTKGVLWPEKSIRSIKSNTVQ
jgi:hypothetical protein